MTKRLLAFLTFVFMVASAMAAPIDGVIVAKLRLSAKPSTVFATIPTRGGDLLQPGYKSLSFNNWYRIKVPIGQEDQCIATLKRQSGVLLAERSYSVKTLAVTPNDPYLTTNFTYEAIPEINYPYMWSWDKVEAKAGWNIYPNALYSAATRPKNAIRVAVIDTGIDETHEDFVNAGGSITNVESGGQIDFTKGCSIFDGVVTHGAEAFHDDQGHGTHVSGIIAAAANNGIGVAGIAYQSVIVPIKVLTAAGSGNDSDVAIALKYAADQNIPVINLSLGGLEYGSLLMEAVNYAFYKGSIILCAGNESGTGGGNLGNIYPGSCSKVLAVSATGVDDEFAATYAGSGMYVGISAPSGDYKIISIDFDGDGVTDFDYPWLVEIWSTIPVDIPFTEPNTGFQDYTYGWALGTSMATPHVSALAALYTEYKSLTQASHDANLRTFQAIQRGADSTNGLANGGHDYMFGYGRINVPATLQDTDQRAATVGSLCGQVLYGGTPAVAADVYVYPMGSITELRTTAQESGLWRLPNIAPGLYRVKARFFGSVKEILNVRVVAGADTPGVDFWLGDVSMQTDETAVDEQNLNVSIAGSTLIADWWARDLLSGIGKYEICLGSAQGLSDIQAWTDYGWKQYDSFAKPAGAAYMGLRVTNGAGIVSTPIWKSLGGGGAPTGTVSVKISIAAFTGDFTKLSLAVTAARTGETLTQSVAIDANGNASFVIPSGTWDITLKPTHSLAKKTTGVVLNGTANMGTLSFTNGDVDGGNSVDLFDYVKLDENFGKPYVAGDLDGSGSVNLFDYVIIDTSFGRVGQ